MTKTMTKKEYTALVEERFRDIRKSVLSFPWWTLVVLGIMWTFTGLMLNFVPHFIVGICMLLYALKVYIKLSPYGYTISKPYEKDGKHFVDVEYKF